MSEVCLRISPDLQELYYIMSKLNIFTMFNSIKNQAFVILDATYLETGLEFLNRITAVMRKRNKYKNI